jgi:hypothetical protein
VAAITFQSSVNLDNPTDVSAFVLWLVVSVKKDGVPSSIDGWRRQGIGRFMIITAIKICYKIYQTEQRKMPVILYLQSQEMASYQFYTNIGFQSLCGHFHDGFEKLPKHVQDLRQPGQSKIDGKCIFHFYKSKDENGEANEMLSSILMCLQYMTLRRLEAETISDSEEEGLSIRAADMAEFTNATVPFWC